MASLKITSISVSGLLCPLIETTKQSRTTYFSTGPFEIWKELSGCTPAASPGTDVSLDVKFEVVGGSLPDKTPFAISALWDQYKPEEVFVKSKFQNFIEDKTDKWDSKNPTVKCSISPPMMTGGTVQKRLPWAFNDTVNWTITVAGKSTTMSTKLELYVLPSYIPKFMINEGIPLGLLRLNSLVPTWMKNSDPDKNDWPNFATKAIFGDSRLWYDNLLGASTYCSYAGPHGQYSQRFETSCWIELWLSDMNGLAGTAGHSNLKKYPVNCMDTAGLVQTIASLNLQDPYAQSYMIFMQPYGFINDTYLIGRYQGKDFDAKTDICNNPFYDKPASMKLDENNTDRKPFGNHYFLTLVKSVNENPLVFDACCGPQVGGYTLPDYIKAAIDTKTTLYTGGFSPGLLSNASYGVGVTSLATPVSFKRKLPTTSDKNLFERMMTALGQSPYVLKEPFEGSPSGNQNLVATWTYVDGTTVIDSLASEVQISIWRHWSAALAKQAYDRRRSSLTTDQRKETLDNDLTYDEGQPGYYMFRQTIQTKHPPPIGGGVETITEDHFLVVIDGNIPNSKIATNVVEKIKKNVFNTGLPANTTVGGWTIPQEAKQVNDKFIVTLRVVLS